MPVVANTVKSFSVSKRMTMSDYNLALAQSLFLLQATELLSENPADHVRANMFRTTIVNTARQIEQFSQHGSHARLEARLPSEPWTFFELDLYWRRWVQLETRRRSCYLIYIYDTLATLETGISCLASPLDVAHMPLPARKLTWNASTAEEWLKAVKPETTQTLGTVMSLLFGLTTGMCNLDDFALYAVLLTVLRGVIDIGEGRRQGGGWGDLTDLWISKGANGSMNGALDRAGLLQKYTDATQLVSGHASSAQVNVQVDPVSGEHGGMQEMFNGIRRCQGCRSVKVRLDQ